MPQKNLMIIDQVSAWAGPCPEGHPGPARARALLASHPDPLRDRRDRHDPRPASSVPRL